MIWNVFDIIMLPIFLKHPACYLVGHKKKSEWSASEMTLMLIKSDDALAMSNSFLKVVPFGGIKPMLGTNPFVFGAPRENKRPLLFDIATSSNPGSKIRECAE